MTVSLREVTAANVRALCELDVAEHQRNMVAPASYTIAEAAYEPDGILRAIYEDETPVGVLAVVLDTETPYIVRLLVDSARQGRGIGCEAVELMLAQLRQQGFESVEVSFVPVEGGAEGFWRRCGFEPTGRESHGEPIFERALGP